MFQNEFVLFITRPRHTEMLELQTPFPKNSVLSASRNLSYDWEMHTAAEEVFEACHVGRGRRQEFDHEGPY